MKKERNNVMVMQLNAVGVVRSGIKTPMLTAVESGLSLEEHMDKIKAHYRQVKESVCELIIDPRWEELLDGIEDFSHILVLYWPHLIEPERRNLRKVHPMGRKDLPFKGIFATCSPARPNPVLVSAVPLIARKANVLSVKGLEALDGSPIVDVKPYSESYLRVDNLNVADWMKKIHRELESD